MSSVPDPMTWKEDAFQHIWDHLEVYAFSPLHLDPLDHQPNADLHYTLIVLINSVVATLGIVFDLCLLVAELDLPQVLILLVRLHFLKDSQSLVYYDFIPGSYPVPHQKERLFWESCKEDLSMCQKVLCTGIPGQMVNLLGLVFWKGFLSSQGLCSPSRGTRWPKMGQSSTLKYTFIALYENAPKSPPFQYLEAAIWYRHVMLLKNGWIWRGVKNQELVTQNFKVPQIRKFSNNQLYFYMNYHF